MVGTHAHMVVEASTLLNHETKVTMEGPTAAVVVAGGSNYIQGTEFSREENQRSDRGATGYKRSVNSAKHSGGRA